MSNEFMREEHYIVFKISDLGNSLKGDEIRRLAREYAEQRRLKGKEPLECVVVEKDWPEYEPTWEAIEARVTGAQPAPGIPEGWKLVPIEPTEKMINEGTCASTLPGPRYIDSACAKQCWTNMLAAAPEANQ